MKTKLEVWYLEPDDKDQKYLKRSLEDREILNKISLKCYDEDSFLNEGGKK